MVNWCYTNDGNNCTDNNSEYYCYTINDTDCLIFNYWFTNDNVNCTGSSTNSGNDVICHTLDLNKCIVLDNSKPSNLSPIQGDIVIRSDNPVELSSIETEIGVV